MLDNRVQEILRLVEAGKTILDIGCAKNPEIHFALAKNCKKIVGIDVDESGIRKIKKKGFEAYVMDAEQIKLDKKFDYIIAGELIEHLNNPGLFLKAMEKHLAPDGRFILTTPNISSILLYILIVVFDQTQDPTHTFYFDKKNLEVLIARFDLQTTSVKYIPPEIKFHGRGILFKIIFFIATLIANLGFALNQRLFGSYLLLTIKKKGE